MLINCYYYAPHNHCLLTRHLDEDLAHIAELGCDAVSYCVQFDQMRNWHQGRLRTAVDRAHAHGLAVHAVPNFLCGLTAGWINGVLWWVLNHRDAWIPGTEGSGYCDPNHPKVRERFEEHVRELVEFGFDGLVWDEPRPPRADVIALMDEMAGLAHQLRPDITVSLFAEAGNLDLAPVLAGTKHIDYLGADGHVRSEGHRMHRMKNTIFRTHGAFSPPLKAAGKKTMFLLEAQRHRNEDLEDYLAVLDRAFALPMDHLMWYYSAHEMSPEHEEPFNEATWQAVRGVSRSR